MPLDPGYHCAGCQAHIKPGEQVEIVTKCRRFECDHKDEKKCMRSTIYAHSDEDCQSLAKEKAG